jgi:lipoprotein-anchoring transpeptidase ErfK/SrfK
MRSYFRFAAALLVATVLVVAGQVYLDVAYAAGANAKGAGFAKQIYKENRKKAEQKANRANPTRPIGP